MLAVAYHERNLFDKLLEKNEYYEIYNFEEHDPRAAKYFESRFESGRELEDFLRSFYGDQVSVQDRDVEADNLCIEINEEVFSDQTINHVLSFLRENNPLFAAIIVLYKDISSFNSG